MTQHPFKAALVGVLLLVALVPAHAGPALLFEADSGRVYYAEDADDQWYPASLTKIMTAYVTFAALKAGKVALDTKIKCSEAANMQPPSKLGLPVGGEITVELALKSLIVKSANDVAVMLAEGVAGTEEAFVAEMNAAAKRLGMTRTNFVNPNGLPAVEQVTTARDLAILSKAVLRDFPEYAEYWTMVDVRIGKRRLGSHNGLLRTYEGADGLKTGFICDAGYNVVASATRDGRRLMAVVLGEPSGSERSIRAASLLDHGFAVQGWKQVLSPKTLENLPYGVDARGPVSVRDDVITWDCGGRARKRAVAKARDQKRLAAKKAKTATADAPTGDGAAKPPAATKTAGDAAVTNAGAVAPAKPKPKTKSAAAPADPKP